MNSVSGETRAASQSPNSSKRKYDTENREKSRQRRDSSNNRKPSRSKSGSRVCYNGDEVADHWASNCPKPKKVGAADERQRNHTPYPRPRGNTPSAERREASQGSNTFRMIRGTWRKGPLVKKADKAEENTEMRPDEPKQQKEKEIQMEIDKVVEQLAKFEIKQRKN